MDINESNWKKAFAIIWAGQAMSLIGSQIVSFAVAWWVTQSTGSAAVLVTMAIFGMLPQVVLGPFIGALVDRWNRRKVMIISDAVIALFALILALLFLTGNAQIWFLYVMALVRGTLGIFHWTAMQASTSLMVPEKQLSRVAGMNQTLQRRAEYRRAAAGRAGGGPVRHGADHDDRRGHGLPGHLPAVFRAHPAAQECGPDPD